MGGRVRNVMAELHGEKIDIVDWSDDPAEMVANALSPGPGQQGRGRRPGGPLRAGDRARLPAVAGDRQGRAERPARRPAHRLADRHPPGHRAGRRRTEPAGRPAATGPDRSAGRRRLRPRIEQPFDPCPKGVRSVRGGRLKQCLAGRMPAHALSAPVWDAGSERPRAICCASWRSRANASPILAVRCPAGVRTCTPPWSVSTWRSAAGRSPGPSGPRDRSTRRSCAGTSSSSVEQATP